MGRLIDADALTEDCERYLGTLNPDRDGKECTRIHWLIGVLTNVPTIEPEPKKGKWINGHWDGDSNFRIDGRGNCWFVRECSNCHEESKGKPTKYCPECGAKMEGD